ncbi:helix-turn-helix transcriptional regulator [Halopiger djelfimassiliensis]|uniref:helix-turn-helix transcriptional regulator n=1 Tax=Halopiger djelfimassiliensis TaxID=1293047 RepID=UPI0006776339|nr:hypothetical protein [Halopiger djelfimassiliensis]
MNRSVSVVFVVFVVTGTLAGVCGVAMVSTAGNDVDDSQRSWGTSAEPEADPPAQRTVASQEFDSTTFEITVHENGSATWTFRYEQRLHGDDERSNEEARQNFEAFAEEFESEETGLYTRFTEQARRLTETDIDRDMEATDFKRTARIDGQLNPIGVVEMSFTWDGFAATENGRVVVGDVFEEKLYITEDQSIVIRPADELRFRSVEPEAQYHSAALEDADAVRWRGDQVFPDGQPRVVFERPGSTAESGDGLASVVADRDVSLLFVVATLVVTLGLGGGLVWYRRNADAFGTDTPDQPAEPADDPDSSPEPTSPPAGTDPSTDPLEDEELLTDEDRVVKLIRENGGRMKQVNIVEETGWSKSKVSMLLSDMESEGTISKLRVGRENIISLEGFEPEATKSPFEE